MNEIEMLNHIADVISYAEALNRGQTEDKYGFLVIDDHPDIMRRYSPERYDCAAEASKLNVSKEMEWIEKLQKEVTK